MKRPAFQFYPSDWRGDMPLQSCSIAARGLWHELLCIMHECVPYGHLAVNGAPMPEANAARSSGVSMPEYRRWLSELDKAGVYSKTAEGVIYSRRMVKDEHLRNVRAGCGRLGGNPNLLNQADKQHDKQMPTPSSSSSSSSSKPKSRADALADARPAKPPANGTRLDPLWTLPIEWMQWAQGERPDWTSLEVERVALVFRDHWHGKAGKEARKTDWLATWRNWVRNERRQYAATRDPTLAERRVKNMDILTGKVRDERTVEGVAERVGKPALLAIPGDLREQGGDDVGGCRPQRSAVGLG